MDNILYRQSPSGTYAIVTPSGLRPAVLQALHDSAGHFGVQRTVQKVQDRYWWPHLKQSVQSYVSSCQTCQQYNRPTSRNVGLLGRMAASDIPFSSIAMDHVTMPQSDDARYILNVIDFATRFLAPAAVSSTSARDVIHHLHGIFYIYGTPDHCLSDHGSAFESAEFKRFMRLHSVELHYSTAYRPEGNGLVERSNGTLLTVLRKISALEPLAWATKLQEAAFAVNTSVNSSTGFSPFQLLFGYVPKLPLQQHRHIQQSSLVERILDMTNQRSEAAANTETAQSLRKGLYDRSHRPHDFTVGDLVWVKRQVSVPHGKLAPRFNGVYRLVEQSTPTTFKAFRISGLGSRILNQPRTVHVSQMKLYIPPTTSVEMQSPNCEVGPSSPTTQVTSKGGEPLCPEEQQPPTEETAEQREASSQLPQGHQRLQRIRRRPHYLCDYELD